MPSISAAWTPVNVVDTQFHDRLVAHAGGEIRKFRYTNSLEALDNSYSKGFRVFELDLELTNDDAVVLLHDWDYSMTHFYHAKPKRYSLLEFKSLKLQDGLTHLEWKDFASWMVKHPDARLITDVKDKPIKMLERIKALSPELTLRIIPQIYKFSEYDSVKEMGFDKIILSLYASDYSDDEIMNFTSSSTLWAVTMPAERALAGDLAEKLGNMNIFTYAHLVDTDKQRRRLEERGLDGFYTAYFAP